MTLLLTAIGSLGLLLLGSALICSATGSLHLERVATVLAAPQLDPPGGRPSPGSARCSPSPGIAFKLSAVPFHLWTPDTYAGAPLPVAAFLAVVSKTAGVAALLVLLAVGLPSLAAAWAPVVGLLAAGDDDRRQPGGAAPAGRRPAAGLVDGRPGRLGAGAAGGGRAGTPAGIRAGGRGQRRLPDRLRGGQPGGLRGRRPVARHHPAGEEHTLEAYRGLARREPVAAGVLAFALACLAGLPPGRDRAWWPRWSRCGRWSTPGHGCSPWSPR